jgi:hypothetical protein
LLASSPALPEHEFIMVLISQISRYHRSGCILSLGCCYYKLLKTVQSNECFITRLINCNEHISYVAYRPESMVCDLTVAKSYARKSNSPLCKATSSSCWSDIETQREQALLSLCLSHRIWDSLRYRARKTSTLRFSIIQLMICTQIIDLLITSLVTGGNETVGRMVDTISGYSTVQFVVCSPLE